MNIRFNAIRAYQGPASRTLAEQVNLDLRIQRQSKGRVSLLFFPDGGLRQKYGGSAIVSGVQREIAERLKAINRLVGSGTNRYLNPESEQTLLGLLVKGLGASVNEWGEIMDTAKKLEDLVLKAINKYSAK
jgi:hypothetical protein